MADVLRHIGPNFTLIPPDLDTDIGLNGSAPGDLAISTVGFSAILWENGEPTPKVLADLLAAPYNLTIDNVSEPAAPLAMYRVNIDLIAFQQYELWIKHATSMIAFRQESFDLETRPENLSVIQGNIKTTMFLATVAVGSPRNVAVNVLDKIERVYRYEGAPNFDDPANIVRTDTLLFYYAVPGQTNPVLVEPL